MRLSLTLSHQRFKAIQATISPINITVLFTHGINKIFTTLNAQDINEYDSYLVQKGSFHYANVPLPHESHQKLELLMY